MFTTAFEKVAGEVFTKSKSDGPIEAARKSYNKKVLVTKTVTKPHPYNDRSVYELWQAMMRSKGLKGAV